MRAAKGDLIESLFLAVFIAGFFGLLYNVGPGSDWPILTTIGLLSFLILSYLLKNQRKNRKKWKKRPITFPNPEGGGILGITASVHGTVNWRSWADDTRERSPNSRTNATSLAK